MNDRIDINEIKISKHYLALVPRMTTDDAASFEQAIKEDGIREPLVLNQDYLLLDGHSRYDQAQKQKIKQLPFRIKNFDDKLYEEKYVIECNLQRRHLTNYQKIELGIPLLKLVSKLAALRKKSTLKYAKKTTGSNEPINKEKGKATEIVAKKIGVSNTMMMRGKVIAEKAPEHLKQKLRDGKSSINSVYGTVIRDTRNLPKAIMPAGLYDVILCDVPIKFDNQGIRGAAANHYPTMSAKELSTLRIPSANNAIMFFWISTTKQYELVNDEGEMTPLYQYVLNSWGFHEVKTEFVWDKKSIGLGSWIRNQHEKCLVAIRGKMPTPAELFSSVISAKRDSHSKKPEIFYEMIEKMYPKRNYLELFARKKHNKNWAVFGNEIEKKDTTDKKEEP